MENLNVEIKVNLQRTCCGARFWSYSGPEFGCFTRIELFLCVAAERLMSCRSVRTVKSVESQFEQFQTEIKYEIDRKESLYNIFINSGCTCFVYKHIKISDQAQMSVTYSGRLGDRYTGLRAQKTLFRFSFLRCISTKKKR